MHVLNWTDLYCKMKMIQCHNCWCPESTQNSSGPTSISDPTIVQQLKTINKRKICVFASVCQISPPGAQGLRQQGGLDWLSRPSVLYPTNDNKISDAQVHEEGTRGRQYVVLVWCRKETQKEEYFARKWQRSIRNWSDQGRRRDDNAKSFKV